MLHARQTIAPSNRKELQTWIQQEIALHGPTCDLNHIDVSHLTQFSGVFQDNEFNGNISAWRPLRMAEAHNMFLGSDFQGDLSNWVIPSTGSFAHKMGFSTQFNGIPPVHQMLNALHYMDMFNTPSNLEKYLGRVPFNTAHFDMATLFGVRPDWLSQQDHDWMQQQKELGKGLGLSHEELRAYAMAQRKQTPVSEVGYTAFDAS